MVSRNSVSIGQALGGGRIQLKKYEPDPASFLGIGENKKPTTPSEWFSQKFPDQTRNFGCPFLELVQSIGDGVDQIVPLSLNIDFFAGVLGGDQRMGHKVIYLPSECQFYFFDPKDSLFKPVSDEKLGNLMRGLFIKCAEELSENVSKVSLFAEFRSDKTIRAIVHRAKSILAADHTFFSVDSKHERQKGPEIHERLARVFVEQALEREPGQILTLTNAYLVFCEYLRTKGMEPVKRSMFKSMFAPLIRECFDLGLRNDVVDPKSEKQTAGWKGLQVGLNEMAAKA